MATTKQLNDAYLSGMTAVSVFEAAANVNNDDNMRGLVKQIIDAIHMLRYGDDASRKPTSPGVPALLPQVDSYGGVSLTSDNYMQFHAAIELMIGTKNNITDIVDHMEPNGLHFHSCGLCHAKALIAELCYRNEAIKAIKVLRCFTGDGLKECKNAIDDLRVRLGIMQVY